MNPIDFHEFYQFLLSEMKECFPDVEYRIVTGGDSVSDLVLEVSLFNHKLSFLPYDLYKSANNNHNYEDVVIQFLDDCAARLMPH